MFQIELTADRLALAAMVFIVACFLLAGWVKHAQKRQAQREARAEYEERDEEETIDEDQADLTWQRDEL